MFRRKRIIIKELLLQDPENNYIDKEITVCGWIETMRIQKQNGIGFISLNDGSCVKGLQIVLDGGDGLKEIYDKGTKGVSLRVKGILVESPAQGQNVELKANLIEILGGVDAAEYPIAKKKLPLEHLRKYPHLRVRTKLFPAVMRIRNSCTMATHHYFQLNGFKYIHTPIITGNDCEGAGETFRFGKNFFGEDVSLTVSGQLHGETYSLGMGDIYTFGPTFRAEKSNTTRHLSEFWMVEPEMVFIDFDELIDVSEFYLKFVADYCIKNNLEELEFLDKNIKPGLINTIKTVLSKPFKRITYTEAIEILLVEIKEYRTIVLDRTIDEKKFRKRNKDKHIFEDLLFWGCDLASEHEKYLTDIIFKVPVIITDYPKEIKSFYMKENSDGKTVQAMDILIPGIGEIIGGSMREDSYEVLKTKMDSKNIDIAWYLDTRKYGSAPHGGFGLGLERLVMLMTGIQNIKDVVPYPRFNESCVC